MLGTRLSCAGLKSCSVNPALLREKPGVFEFPPSCESVPGVGFIASWHLSLSYPPACDLFLSFPSWEGAPLPVFLFLFSRKIVSYTAVESVCSCEGVSSGPSCIVILNQNPQILI